jgi:hypothetical protein
MLRPASNRQRGTLVGASRNIQCPLTIVLLRALQFMKLFSTSYVFTGEEKAKLYVAEKRDDDSNTETTAASRRSPESLAGADCGTSPALERWREYASGPSATGFF